MSKIGLEEAIEAARFFFVCQCGKIGLSKWEIHEATEDIAKDVYVIKCTEHCYFETDRTHIVWVNCSTGKIEHTHRVCDKKEGNQ